MRNPYIRLSLEAFLLTLAVLAAALFTTWLSGVDNRPDPRAVHGASQD